MASRTSRAVIAQRQITRACISRTLLCCAVIPGALAAGYPDHPVRLIVPSLAGGGTDTTTRIITPRLAEYLGQQIVIDNRGGMSGNLGAELASRAAPDGYTLLATLASHTSNPAVIKNTPYDLERDFAPISMTVVVPNLLYSHPSLPVKTISELIAFARARPGQLNYASAGVGSTSHLAMALLLSMTGVKMLHVPYKGASQAAIDVMAGHLPLTFGNIMNALPHVHSGRVRALGVTSAKRVSAAPDIPAIAEAGLPGYEAVQWYGLLAPAGTPREIITKLHAGVLRALQDPAVRKRFIDDGAEPAPSGSPEEFGARIHAEIAKWAKVVTEAGIKPE